MLNHQKKWICAQIGAREHYMPPRALARQGVLECCLTDFWAGPLTRKMARSVPRLRSLGNRYQSELEKEKVFSFNRESLGRSLIQNIMGARDTASVFKFHAGYGKWFALKVRYKLEGMRLDAGKHRYFGFTTGALETLEYLREKGIFTVVQQIDPARTEDQLVSQERVRWAQWELGSSKIPESYFARLQSEWDLASIIVVNSEWSRRALIEQGVPARKLVVIPLAYEGSLGHVAPQRDYLRRPLRVVWLGTVNLRKGIPYLIEAARLLEKRKVEFCIAGPFAINKAVTADWPSNVKILGRVQRDEVPRIIAEGDVYVLPTISDGFALTQLEAMAEGLPVITTPNCGEVVTDGIDGFIVPACDSVSLAEAIAKYDDDRDLLARMASAALEKVKLFSLDKYGQQLRAAAASLSCTADNKNLSND